MTDIVNFYSQELFVILACEDGQGKHLGARIVEPLVLGWNLSVTVPEFLQHHVGPLPQTFIHKIDQLL